MAENSENEVKAAKERLAREVAKAATHMKSLRDRLAITSSYITRERIRQTLWAAEANYERLRNEWHRLSAIDQGAPEDQRANDPE